MSRVLSAIVSVALAFVSGCATEPHDVAIFGHSADYHAGVLVGARPGQCLVADDARAKRWYMPCERVATFLALTLHVPAGGKILTLAHTDRDWEAFKVLNMQLTAVGLVPDR